MCGVPVKELYNINNKNFDESSNNQQQITTDDFSDNNFNQNNQLTFNSNSNFNSSFDSTKSGLDLLANQNHKTKWSLNNLNQTTDYSPVYEKENNIVNSFFRKNKDIIGSIVGQSSSMPKRTKLRMNNTIANPMYSQYNYNDINNNIIAYSTGALQGTQVQNDNDFVTEDGISYDYKQQVIQNNKQVDQKQSFYNASNNVYNYLKQKGADFGGYYKANEAVITVASGVELGSLSGLSATYIGPIAVGKVVLNIGMVTRIAGETCYQLAVSTESGINKTMHIAGSLLAELFANKTRIGGRLKSEWTDPEKLAQYGKTQADVDIVATIFNYIEGTSYSKMKNVIIDEYGGNLEKYIERGKEIYEW